MKILYVLQQSIYDSNGKWISADSNINMFAGIVSKILEIKPDWEFFVLIGLPFKDIKKPTEILNHKNVHYIENNYPVSSVLSRYHFDVNNFVKLFKEVKPDVIWNNIPSLTRNWRAIIEESKNSSNVKNPLLINCNYWIDTLQEPKVFDERTSYGIRQIDGALAADLVPFTCNSTKEIFLEEVKLRLGDFYYKKILEKSTIWDFGFSSDELLQNYSNKKFDKVTIVFPNRLSGINYTHHKEFIEAVNELYVERQDFQVIFTNPSQKISWETLRKNVLPLTILKTSNLTRKEYVNLLWSSDIVVNLFDKERYGGCANVEAIFCKCLPIMTRYGEYKRRAAKAYKYFIDLPISPAKIKQKLNLAIDEIKHNGNEASAFKNVMLQEVLNSSFEIVNSKVVKDIEDSLLMACSN
jgi:hypothetical protein